MTEERTLIIPLPSVAPTGFEIDRAEPMHDIWGLVMGEQNGRVQSIEDRMLMATLRAVHEGFDRLIPCAICATNSMGGPQ